ncbi:MAG: UDP-3-O-[3-hydroxymyristoyl] N-acetylglucosamine deacetylase [Candidatus Aminicenantes bacterium RBG_13_62_12]|nr:MAG: UDP-3-O-[3-hydroxymyristoyl] N-acetylglucosamine deacetylase [Candidatus Aminicenantes bacterium RBG_13_62_12]
MSERKYTLAAPARFSGVGAHTGKFVRVVLEPSDVGRVVFRRRDLDSLVVAVDPARSGARNCTLLSGEGACVRTVEHLLAALLMCGIDSAEVELDGEEVPILDGSALPLVRIIREAGKSPLADSRRVLVLAKPLALEEGPASIVLEPSGGFEISYSIEYRHPLIGEQRVSFRLDEDTFRTQIAPARTFGFLKDAEKLRAKGLALGSSLENTVVLDDERVVNPPLRFPDEFVRHKVLDLVGDLALLGAPLRTRVSAVRAGHDLHLRAVRALHENKAEFFQA